MAIWDYKVLKDLTDNQIRNGGTKLKDEGDAGWELVNVVHLATDDNVAIFKKRLG